MTQLNTHPRCRSARRCTTSRARHRHTIGRCCSLHRGRRSHPESRCHCRVHPWWYSLHSGLNGTWVARPHPHTTHTRPCAHKWIRPGNCTSRAGAPAPGGQTYSDTHTDGKCRRAISKKYVTYTRRRIIYAPIT